LFAWFQEILEQFLANLANPEFEKVWMDLAGNKAGAGGRTRNKKDNNTMSAKAFLKKFTPMGKASSSKPKHFAPPSVQPVSQYVSPQPMLFAPASAQGAPTGSVTQDWLGVIESMATTTPAVEAKPQSLDILLKAQQQQSHAAPVAAALSTPTPVGVGAPPTPPKPTPSASATPSDAMDIDELMANIPDGEFGAEALGDLDFELLDDVPGLSAAGGSASIPTAPTLDINTADLDKLFEEGFPM
jgi:hypothetical protein